MHVTSMRVNNMQLKIHKIFLIMRAIHTRTMLQDAFSDDGNFHRTLCTASRGCHRVPETVWPHSTGNTVSSCCAKSLS